MVWIQTVMDSLISVWIARNYSVNRFAQIQCSYILQSYCGDIPYDRMFVQTYIARTVMAHRIIHYVRMKVCINAVFNINCIK